MNTQLRSAYLTVRKYDPTTPAACRPVLMITRRCLRPGQHGQFEQALNSFLRFAVPFPGHLDAHVLSWIRDDGTHFAVVHRFSDAVSRQRFTSSPDYGVWLIWLQQFTDAESTNDTAGPNPPPPNTPLAWLLAWAGAILAFGLVGVFTILPAVVYLKPPAWYVGDRQALSFVLLLAMAGWLGMAAWPRALSQAGQK